MPKFEVTVRFVVTAETEDAASLLVSSACENMVTSGGDIVTFETGEVMPMDTGE